MIPVSLARRKLLLGAGATLAGAVVIPGVAKAAQFEFKSASNFARDHPLSVRMTQMWHAIEQESGGRVRGQVFPDSQLGGDTAMFNQLRVGALQFMQLSPGNLASVVPAADISFVGFAFKDADEGLRVMDGALGNYIRKEAIAKGIYTFNSAWNAGMNQLCSSVRPVRTPDDLQGLKIRVLLSRIQIDLFKGLGASPTPLSVNEVYTALQTKIVDGVAAPLAAIETQRWYEINKYISLTNHGWSLVWMVANGDAWKSLPPDLQAIIDRNNQKYAMMERRDIKLVDASLTTKLTRQGMTINPVDQAAFRTRLRPYYETWANAFGPTEWGLLESGIGRKLT